MKALSLQLHLQAESPPSEQETLLALTTTTSQANITRTELALLVGQLCYSLVLPRPAIRQGRELLDIADVSNYSQGSCQHHRELARAQSDVGSETGYAAIYIYLTNT